jgi:hypothetical protein
MFIIPHGAPGGYEWFVALVVLVGLSISVFAISSGRILPSPPKYLKKARPLDGLPDPNPVRPGPGPEERLHNIQRGWSRERAKLLSYRSSNRANS